MIQRIEEYQWKLLHEDDDILVCVKPPRVATETRRMGQKDMVSLLRNYLVSRGGKPYVGLVHRLDQPVEGILVFGKHPKSAAKLSRQLAEGGFSKIYLAVTEGTMVNPEGQLVDYLKKDARTNTSRVVSDQEQNAKRAELSYQVLQTLRQEPEYMPVSWKTCLHSIAMSSVKANHLESKHACEYNLVRIRLGTGRHHQIRVQMAHLGNPIVGDQKYGSSLAQDAIGLCACELHFIHPVSRKQMSFHIDPTGEPFRLFNVH